MKLWPFVKKSTYDKEVERLRAKVGAEYARGLRGGEVEAANARRKQHKAENDLTRFVQMYTDITPSKDHRQAEVAFTIRVSEELVTRGRFDHGPIADRIGRLAAAKALNTMSDHRSYR